MFGCACVLEAKDKYWDVQCAAGLALLFERQPRARKKLALKFSWQVII